MRHKVLLVSKRVADQSLSTIGKLCRDARWEGHPNVTLTALHRDDITAKLAECVVSSLRRADPKAVVSFAGDVPLCSDELRRLTAMGLLIEYRASLCAEYGTCRECGDAMPNYPDNLRVMTRKWRPHRGWFAFQDVVTGCFVGWMCPSCQRDSTMLIGYVSDD